MVLVVVQLFDGKGRTFARENPKSPANSSAIAELHLATDSSGSAVWNDAPVLTLRGGFRMFYVILGVASIALHLSCLLDRGLDPIESAYLVVAKENYIWCEPRCQDVPKCAKMCQVSSTVLGSANLCNPYSNPN